MAGASVMTLVAAVLLCLASSAAAYRHESSRLQHRRLHSNGTAIPAGFKNITCNPAPNPRLGFNNGKDPGKVCGIWYDEIACKEVDRGNTFGANASDICCAKGPLPPESRALEIANWHDCIVSQTGKRASCASTKNWPQKVCCVPGVCT